MTNSTTTPSNINSGRDILRAKQPERTSKRCAATFGFTVEIGVLRPSEIV